MKEEEKDQQQQQQALEKEKLPVAFLGLVSLNHMCTTVRCALARCMIIQNAHQLATYAKMNFYAAIAKVKRVRSFYIYYIVLNILFLNQSLLQSPASVCVCIKCAWLRIRLNAC